MQFKKYTSLENTYREKYLDKIRIAGLSGGWWYVQEKVHGANFSIWYDVKTEEIKCAKRSTFLGPEADFNNYEAALPENKDLVGAFKGIKAENEIVLCGEIAGGQYDHKDVAKVPGAKKVQKGVQYAPHNFFYCFDIKIDGKFVSEVHFNVLSDLLKNLRPKIVFAEPLFIGNFDECLKFSNEFQTTIPAAFRLPEIEGNTCEGVVIKPGEPKYFQESRIALKNKNEAFSEKQKGSKGPQQPQEPEAPLSEEAENVLSTAYTLINENRLRNVLSKEERVDNPKQFGMILGKLTQDVLEDLEKEMPRWDIDISRVEQKQINKKINKQAANLLKVNFQDILAGDF